MKTNQIASLSLKILGIYSLIQAITLLRGLSTVVAMFVDPEMERGGGGLNAGIMLVGVLLSIGLLLMTGLCLIIFSKALSNKMVLKEENNNSTTELSASNIQAISFSVVGLVMVVLAIPHIVQLAATLEAMRSATSEMAKRSISISSWTYNLALGAQFVAGILLFLGGKGLSTFWFYLQKMRPMKDV
jgi:hypothetical protein